MIVRIICNGNKFYYSGNDTGYFKLHNSYGCAFKIDKTKSYFINDKLHNELGPAIIYKSGRKVYYLHGRLNTFHSWSRHNNK